MKTYKIKLVIEDYTHDGDVNELVAEIKQNLKDGVLLVKSSVTEIEYRNRVLTI